VNVRPNFKSVALPVPEIIAIGVLGRVSNLQSRERGSYVGGREWVHSKVRW